VPHSRLGLEALELGLEPSNDSAATYTQHVPGAVTEHHDSQSEADVILDVELERGLLFLVVQNLGRLPAHNVRVRFGQPLHGLGGERRVDRLEIFRRLEFLDPRRRDFPYLEVPDDA
jgi:hypothetical protein